MDTSYYSLINLCRYSSSSKGNKIMTAKAEEEMTNATIYLENAGGAGITR